jgi:hypothetical protein
MEEECNRRKSSELSRKISKSLDKNNRIYCLNERFNKKLEYLGLKKNLKYHNQMHSKLRMKVLSKMKLLFKKRKRFVQIRKLFIKNSWKDQKQRNLKWLRHAERWITERTRKSEETPISIENNDDNMGRHSK